MSGFSHFRRVSALHGSGQAMSWLAVLLLALAVLTTTETSLYLHALQDFSPGPRTETADTGLSCGFQREPSSVSKRRTACEFAPDGSSAPETTTSLLALTSPWPALELGADTPAFSPTRQAGISRPPLRHSLSPRAPPAMA